MNATIQVNAETARGLAALAASRGLSLDDLLKTTVLSKEVAMKAEEHGAQASKVREFIEWTKTRPKGRPILSDPEISRQSIYEV